MRRAIVCPGFVTDQVHSRLGSFPVHVVRRRRGRRRRLRRRFVALLYPGRCG